jgi:Planctomycete cytochrome C.
LSDYSYKQRWVYVPNNKKAQYEENWVFNFPVGSALIKTFYYPVDERNPDLGMNLLETRLLLRKENGWEAVSYAWNEEQNEAYKKIAGKTINVSWTDFMGNDRNVRYRVPNVNQCKECHAADDKITPIGPKARNLNKKFEFNDGEFNQLTYWMNRQIIDDYPMELVSPVDWTDESQNINDRVRSYLDVNCGHCHSPTGNANSTGLYLHLDETRNIHLGLYKKPVATGRGSGGLKYSIVPGKPDESILLHRMISLDPGVMMPES